MKSAKQIKRFAVVMGVAVLAIGALAGSALAAGDDGTSAVLTGGSLNISTALAAGTFAGTLTVTAQVLRRGEADFSGFSINDPARHRRRLERDHAGDCVRSTRPSPARTSRQLAHRSAVRVAKADAGSSAVPGTLHAAATIDTGDVRRRDGRLLRQRPGHGHLRLHRRDHRRGSSPSPPTSTPAPTTAPSPPRWPLSRWLRDHNS